jgi:DeoR family transcriptional regulator of aga operon
MTFESNPPATARRQQIQAIVHQHGFARVSELSEQFGVSEVTVRGDLDALSETSTIRRVHGGAVLDQPASDRQAGAREHPFEFSLAEASAEKARIGIAAASLVQSGHAIVLDVGTTTTAIANALIARTDLSDVIVVTNSLNIALALEPLIPRFTVIVTGGTLRPLQHSLVEPLAGSVLKQVRADFAFIGCSGVDAIAGVTNINLPEADLKRRMLATAAQRIVVADSTKLGVTQLSRVAPLADIDALITGTEATPAQLAPLAAAGLRITRA